MLPLQENNPAVSMWRERSRIHLFLRLALSSPMLAPLFSVSPGLLEPPGPEPPRDSVCRLSKYAYLAVLTFCKNLKETYDLNKAFSHCCGVFDGGNN